MLFWSFISYEHLFWFVCQMLINDSELFALSIHAYYPMLLSAERVFESVQTLVVNQWMTEIPELYLVAPIKIVS